MSHEVGHFMGFGYIDNNIGFTTHWGDGIMSGNPNREVSQADIDLFNFSFGLMKKPDKTLDRNQLSQDFKDGIKYIGNSSKGIIDGPFKTSQEAIDKIDKIK